MSDIPQQDLDLSLLHEIADGSSEFIVESIDLFLKQSPESLKDISDGIATQNWEMAYAAAHKLKATLGFFGMLNTQSLIQDIETSCKTGSPDAADVLAKFKQAEGLINGNIGSLLKVQAEAAAG